MEELIKIRFAFVNYVSKKMRLNETNDPFQKSCIDFAINAKPIETYIPPKRKEHKYKVWKMVVSTPFDYFIMLLIVLNTLLLMMKV